MSINLLARAFRQKAPEYLRFSPIENDDQALCVNCGKPHDDHHRHGACPLADGSGFSLNMHYRRVMSDAVGELTGYLEEIGEAPK
jgi:hypothetical protein